MMPAGFRSRLKSRAVRRTERDKGPARLQQGSRGSVVVASFLIPCGSPHRKKSNFSKLQQVPKIVSRVRWYYQEGFGFRWMGVSESAI